jgi:F0F1-type ATP synthase membrane subunit c/vacuolar-type H+-ATPase subunit K
MTDVPLPQSPDQSEREPHSPNQRPVTTVPRVLSLTALTILLAGGVPFCMALLLIIVPRSILSNDASFVLSGFFFMVMLLVVPVILGATFYWANSRFRTARFPQIWLETTLLAGGIMCFGPLLGMLTQAVSSSFGGHVPLDNFSGVGEPPMHPLHPFTLAWSNWQLIETGWSPIWFIQIGLAIGLGGLGTGLAQGLARWSLVRGAPAILPRQQRGRLAVQVIGSVAVILVGSTLVFGPALLQIENPVDAPAVIASVFLVPSTMLSVLAGIQTWRLRHLVPPGTVSSTLVPPWGPDEQAEFSIGPL